MTTNQETQGPRWQQTAEGRAAHSRYAKSEKGKATVRRYKATPQGTAAVILANCMARARGMQKSTGATGKRCTLTRAWLTQRILAGSCTATGIAFQFNTRSRWRPSPDRQKQDVGYLKTNVRLTCWAFNKARGAKTDPRFLDDLVDRLRELANSEGIPMRRRPRRLTRRTQ